MPIELPADDSLRRLRSLTEQVRDLTIERDLWKRRAEHLADLIFDVDRVGIITGPRSVN